MRIAWVSFGFGEYCVRHANSLVADHEVMLILPTEVARGCIQYIDSAVTLYTFNGPRLRQPLRQFRSIQRIIKQIHNFRPDVVHFQNGHLWFNWALCLLRRFPLVVTVHDPRHHEGDAESRKTPQRLMDFGFRRADRVIVHGKAIAKIVRDEIMIAEEKIHVIPHIAIGDVPRQRSYGEDERSVLFFGRIWAYKGLEYLIRAEPLISEQIGEVRITISGKGEKFYRYRREMKNPERFIVCNSRVSDDERARMFQRAAVVVLPYVSATQSGVVPIAFTFSKPVVATLVGALPEYVDHGVNGFLVPPRNEKALADAIVLLLRDKDLRISMGINGRRKLLTEWAPDVVSRSTEGVYEAAIRDRRGIRVVATAGR